MALHCSEHVDPLHDIWQALTRERRERSDTTLQILDVFFAEKEEDVRAGLLVGICWISGHIDVID